MSPHHDRIGGVPPLKSTGTGAAPAMDMAGPQEGKSLWPNRIEPVTSEQHKSGLRTAPPDHPSWAIAHRQA